MTAVNILRPRGTDKPLRVNTSWPPRKQHALSVLFPIGLIIDVTQWTRTAQMVGLATIIRPRTAWTAHQLDRSDPLFSRLPSHKDIEEAAAASTHRAAAT